MPPPEVRRSIKRSAVSDQQRRRELALLRQSQQRSDSQNRARRLASSVVALSSSSDLILPDKDVQTGSDSEGHEAHLDETVAPARELNVAQASKLKGREARQWFARQLMFPEWMIDIPPQLDRDW